MKCNNKAQKITYQVLNHIQNTNKITFYSDSRTISVLDKYLPLFFPHKQTELTFCNYTD